MKSVRLLADIGGTNARFAWQRPGRKPAGLRVLAVSAHATLSAAISHYLSRHELPGPVTHAALAVAGPVTGDRVELTNSPWSFTVSALRSEFGLRSLQVLNDFAALALALPLLRPDERIKLGRGRPTTNAPLAVLGPGTGLGMAGLVFTDRGPVAVPSEGGKVALAAVNALEAEVIAILRRSAEYVTAEHVLSGPGLVRLYRALATATGGQARATTPTAITRAALARRVPLAVDTVRMFTAMLGTVAGDLALTLGARGGVYLGGGIIPRLGEALRRSPFRERFEQRGDFSPYLIGIPTYAITARTPALRGLAASLDEQDDTEQPGGAPPTRRASAE